jgi:hypothetical protein
MIALPIVGHQRQPPKLPKVVENAGIDRENVFWLTFRSHSASGTMGFFGETISIGVSLFFVHPRKMRRSGKCSVFIPGVFYAVVE